MRSDSRFFTVHPLCLCQQKSFEIFTECKHTPLNPLNPSNKGLENHESGLLVVLGSMINILSHGICLRLWPFHGVSCHDIIFYFFS